MKKGALIFLALVAAAAMASEEVLVEGDENSTYLLRAQNLYTNATDKVALFGKSTPQPYYGIGVRGEGAYRGVEGISTLSGTGTRFGVHGYASGGNYNYGVYGYAPGGTNSYAGYFAGNLAYTGTLSGPVSDVKFKSNINDLKNNLEKLKILSPKQYTMKKNEYPSMGFDDKEHYGLIAQEVEKYFPNLVSENPLPPQDGKSKEMPKETYKSIDYIALIPVLIGAIQELNAKIEKLEGKNK